MCTHSGLDSLSAAYLGTGRLAAVQQCGGCAICSVRRSTERQRVRPPTAHGRVHAASLHTGGEPPIFTSGLTTVNFPCCLQRQTNTTERLQCCSHRPDVWTGRRRPFHNRKLKPRPGPLGPRYSEGRRYFNMEPKGLQSNRLSLQGPHSTREDQV